MIIEDAARDELLAAAFWYDEQREGLGSVLLAVVDEALGRIEVAPQSFPRDTFDARARRTTLDRFPYAVIFLVHDEEVRVVAFAHAKRLPGYWGHRV